MIKTESLGTSLVVQWLSLCASTAGGVSLIPLWGTKIPHAKGATKKKKGKSLHFPTLPPCSQISTKYSTS